MQMQTETLWAPCDRSRFGCLQSACRKTHLCLPAQALEFEDYKNDTQYEEYEEYEDNFKFAERDRADTWDGEVILPRDLNHSVSNDSLTHTESFFSLL